ncbi:DUF4157 domain-containing protein [Methylotuvimicrobium sp. KM1]|uniref:eCIS core domain-containing protein n=1 Tax=Methylotuvimicrobium sp. KM1 TaxID=3377707 RepID=UPI00384C476C
MKTGVKKSSGTVSKPANQAFFAKAGSSGFFAAANEPKAPAVQLKMTANKPGDKFENEADNMADKVMKMPAPEERVQKAELPEEKVQKQEEPLQKAELPEEKVQKQEEEPLQKAEEPERAIQKQEDEKLQKAERPEDKLQKAEAPEDKLQKQEEKPLQRAKAPEEELQKAELPDEEIRKKEEEQLQRKGDGAPGVSSQVQSAIHNKTTGGEALSGDVRGFMEPRFGADFSNVRIHRDAESGGLSNQLSAKAFTFRNHIFFSHDQYRPGTGEGKQLLAHELTHTIQQGAAVQRSPQVTTTATPPALQRGFLPDPRDFIARKAALIPGFPMLTVVIGMNPVTGAAVDRSPGNIMRGVISLLPGIGPVINQALDNHGIFSKISDWVYQQFDALKEMGSGIWESVKQFIKERSITDIKNLDAVWEQGKRLITGPIDRVKSFAAGLVGGIADLIKDAILKPIAEFARSQTNAYPLLCSVLGKDPITGDKAPDDAEALIGGFMNLINQGDVWAKIQEANAVPRCMAWFKKSMQTVKTFAAQIPGLFIAAFKALEIKDIILIPLAFGKLAKVFGSFAGQFIGWAGSAVWNLLEIIFDTVKPGVMGIVKRTGGALKAILKNPLPFVGNLAAAGKLGFQQFAGNFLGHLKKGLFEWLTGSLPGVYIPASFALGEIAKFVFSVLGLTWQNMRVKLVKVLGEKTVQALETGFDIVKTLVTQGPAAAWDKIKDQLSDLKDTVIGGIISMVVDMVVKKAVPKIVSMFIPGAGFISAILSIYDLVMVVVQKLSKIAQVGAAFIGSIVQIAAGNIGAAAKRVESVLAGILSLAISFLAGFAGFGKVADKVLGVINKVRVPIDKALDKLIGWIVGRAKALFSKLFGKKDDKRTENEKKRDLESAIRESEILLDNPKISTKRLDKKLISIKKKYKLTSLTLVKASENQDSETSYVSGEVNPKLNSRKVSKSKSSGPLVASVKVTSKGVSKDVQERLTPAEHDWAEYERGAMQNVVLGELIPEWEERTGVPITTSDQKLESAQYMARFKTQKAFRVGSRRPRPEGRVEIKQPGGKGKISHVFAVEVTTIRDLTDTSGESGGPVRHKLAQIPNTIETLISKYGPGPQIEYTIICPRDLKPDEQAMLESLVNRPDAKNLKIVWVKTGA